MICTTIIWLSLQSKCLHIIIKVNNFDFFSSQKSKMTLGCMQSYKMTDKYRNCWVSKRYTVQTVPEDLVEMAEQVDVLLKNERQARR